MRPGVALILGDIGTSYRIFSIFVIMKTVYANTWNPKAVKWGTTVIFIVSGALFVGGLLFRQDRWDLSWLFPFCWSFFYFGFLFREYKLCTYEIDDEADTLKDSRQKKYPLKLSQLTTATYKESKKGRFRSLFLHDCGTGFMDIRTSRENADKIVARIREINPGIEVKHANYL